MYKYLMIFVGAFALMVWMQALALADALVPAGEVQSQPLVSLVEALGAGLLALLGYGFAFLRGWLKWAKAREAVTWAETRLALAVLTAKNTWLLERDMAMSDGVFSADERARARRRALDAFWSAITPEILAGALKSLGFGDGQPDTARAWASNAVEAALPPAVGPRPSMPAPR